MEGVKLRTVISTLKFIHHAQSSLDVGKPSLVIGRQKPLAALGNNDPPAVLVIMDHS